MNILMQGAVLCWGEKFANRESSLQDTITLLGIPEISNARVREIKRTMCPTVAHWMHSLLSPLAQVMLLGALYIVGAMGVLSSAVLYFEGYFSLGAAIAAASSGALFFIGGEFVNREDRSGRTILWTKIEYSPTNDSARVAVSFGMPKYLRESSVNLAGRCPTARFYVEYDLKDPFLWVVLRRMRICIGHWERPAF